SLTDVVRVEPNTFFRELARRAEPRAETRNFRERWRRLSALSRQALAACLQQSDAFSELAIVNRIVGKLERPCHLHLGNSMPVRYANMAEILAPAVKVYGNRGTSGIDGCTSTALGHALVGDVPNILIVGDMSVLYDRNAFWNNYIPDNFKVVVLNNHGGGIFKHIDGPSRLPELDEFYVTRQRSTAEPLAREAGLAYFAGDDWAAFDAILGRFLDPETGAAMLELFTDNEVNVAVFRAFQQQLKTHFERSRAP
ncbi:MAG: 2-succinyl-5-enolpyruvyl-6-hydroxy-3-cyclohexene-1-carboxylic-acid synthase, partial [Gammaproteobacteria bacterium]